MDPLKGAGSHIMNSGSDKVDNSCKNEVNIKVESAVLDESNTRESPSYRRSSRKIKKPSLFKITHHGRPDPELLAAIKRSKLDTCQHNTDYASIAQVPTIFATVEEFKSPITIWNKYSDLGEKFGAIKVVPPDGWRAPLPVDLETFKFQVREQRLQQLLNGNGFSHPPWLWDCAKMKEHNNQLLEEVMKSTDPPLDSIEKEYWRLIKSGDSKVVSYYGADLNFVSQDDSENSNSKNHNVICRDPWNMKNLPKCNGSLLRYLNAVVPGVNSPWLYIGMCFTSFCWHTEDNYFGSVNYHHVGAPKIWYVVPPAKAGKMEALLKNFIAMESEEFALYSLRVQVPPDVLISNDIPIYRIVQQENEFVLVWPRTFHAGFNAGFNSNEACNIAPASWIKMGYQSLLNYRYARKTCIPFFRIILSAIPNFLDLEPIHISHIIDCVTLLLIQEYKLRTSQSLPMYQMFLDMDSIAALDDVKAYLASVLDKGFEPNRFLRAIINTESTHQYHFLVACKELASFSVKDCDLCDSPTLGSCVMCNHINTVVCISCLGYHECDCKTRVILYRFTLYSIYNIILILKRAYFSITNQEWSPSGTDYKVPSKEEILKVDESSYFTCHKLKEALNSLKQDGGLSSDRGAKWANENYAWALGNDANMDKRPKLQTTKLEKIKEAYEDMNNTCRKLRKPGGPGTKRKRGSTTTDNIAIKYPCTISKLLGKNPLAKTNIILVTKITLKYLILSIQEDLEENT
ncbi:jumonji/arid domain containing protein [Theileria equi strain WA]|uniref:Jumonji/arid domain containing protein n=1 Tax=Theileria equi strain WA TaxID=1537102 RepID=L0AY89_THEEQ|nr:jumonji/arid domain containing protein [Theileria equi strain WA]AFZ80547.1 jumonji/arid domain containing protein [Theileria equi strain WA]|eukprot:XP_004830213.1 jumonji/arid domain containing protein [Theileria equi strain WA]